MLRWMVPLIPTPTNVAQAEQIGHIIELAVAPVFLLAGVGAFLNVCAGRLSRIVDRSRDLEPRILASRGREHDRLLADIRVLDRRMGLVSRAIFLSVLSALLTCAVVILLFATGLTDANFSTAIALLFIASMIAIGAGFAIFLVETRVGSRAVRIRSHILEHEPEEKD
jgi:MFS family permease